MSTLVSQKFGMAVRKRRDEIGFTQEELAEQAGLHRTYIGHVERGTRNPTLETIARIALALGSKPTELLVSIDDLFPLPLSPSGRIA